MQDHISGLQDIVAKRTRQIIEWAELRLKRITMSHDADNHPAELYGKDGRINYRNAGREGVGLGTGIQGELNTDVSFYGSASDDLNFVKFLEWDHDTDRLSTQTETFTLGHDNTSASLSTGFYFYRGTVEDKEASLGWNEIADRFEFMEEVSPAPTLAEILIQSLKLASEPSSKVGTIVINDITGDMEFTDATLLGMKTLSELASGGGGVTNPLTSDLDADGHDIDDIGSLIFRTSLTHASIGFDTFDWLEYDCNADVYKFYIGASPALSIGLESIICGADIDMGNRNITGLGYIEAFDVYGIDLKNSAGTTKGILAHTDYALQCEGAGINMNGQDVECVDVISGCGVNDLRFYDAVLGNFVTLSQLAGGGSGASLWEDMGSYVRLIVADDVDFRAKNILHLASLRSNFTDGMTIFDSAGATKAYLGTTDYALKAFADINMNGNGIKDMGARYGKLNTLQQWYYVSSGGGTVKKMELNALAFNLFCKLDMGNHNIEDVNTIKGHTETDLKFFDDVLNETKTLSQLATSGLWEVSGSVIRPKGYDIIEGRATHDLTIRPASGGILYLG